MTTSPQCWKQAKPILQQALSLPDEERGAYLDAACGSDYKLRAYLDRLLGVDAKVLNLFEASPVGGAGKPLRVAVLEPGDKVDRYRIVRHLGEGGMGRVYAAQRQDQPFVKTVAIKVLHRHGDRDDMLVRFREECQILARLDHPHIARILDGGVTDEGLAFMVMELVDGIDLKSYLRTHSLDLPALLVLFEKICRAVHYAHQNLIIHRDLKPGNVMVTGDGEPILLDFGISKILSPESSEAEHTRPGQRSLTPEYASPEQLTGARVNTATDIFSLGVILYEALTGQRPLEVPKDGSAGVPSYGLMADQMKKPSVLMKKKKKADRDGPSSLKGGQIHPFRPAELKGDLDAIVLKALQGIPDQRYVSAANLADDLQRRRLGRPVKAQKETLFYLARKFVGRHRLGVGLVLLLCSGLVLVTIALGIQRQVAISALDRATKEKDRAGAMNEVLLDLFQRPDPYQQGGSELTVRELMADALADLDHQVPEQVEMKIQLLQAFSLGLIGMDRLDEAVDRLSTALALVDTHLPPKNSQKAKVLAHRGLAFLLSSRLKEARADLEEALRLQNEILPQDHPDFVRTLQNLGIFSLYTFELERGLEYLTRALQIHRSHPNRPDLDLAQAHDLFGKTQMWLGNIEQAEIHIAKGLEIRRRKWQQPHPAVAESLNSMGTLLIHQGALQGGISHLLESLLIEEARFGPCHLSALYTRVKLADAYAASKQLDKAETLYWENVACGDQTNRPCRIELNATWNNLGAMYLNQRRLVEARTVFEQNLKVIGSIYGVQSPPFARGLVNLGATAKAGGNFQLARTIYGQAIEKLTQSQNLGSFEHAMVLANQAHLEEAEGHFQEAIQMGTSSVEMFVSLLGKDHPISVRAAKDLDRWQGGLSAQITNR